MESTRSAGRSQAAAAMKPIDGALMMAALGLPVFPLKAGTKDGHLSKSWKAAATTDAAKIKALGARWPGCNWGARCVGLLTLDVDTADGKPGVASYGDIVLDHGIPPTRVHASARGGQHVFLRLPAGVEVTNRDAPLGEGVNVRGSGGYVLCPGSTFEGKPYRVLVDAAIGAAPASLVELLRAPAAVKGEAVPEALQDNSADIDAAISWLQHREPVGKGERGSTAYKCAARLRDWGITRGVALDLIAEHFGARCEPPLHDGDGPDGCRHEVFSAFKNSQNSAGARSVAVDFDDVSDIAEEIAEAGKHVPPAARNAPLKWPVLAVDKAGNTDPSKPAHRAIENIRYALAYTDTRLWFDEFAGRRRVSSRFFGFEPDGELTDDKMERVRLHCHELGLQPPKDHFVDVARDLARQSPRHPVREYLAGLKWDGVPRLASLFPGYVGSADTPLTRAAGRLFMVAAVRRVRKPGEKFDFMVVLEGAQETGKSGFVGVLARGWHSENFSLGDDPKVVIEQARGKWIIEVAELNGLSTPRGREHVKALITRTVDEARPAYGRETERVKRQWVLIATTNDREYLSDPTGNRRFLPIEAPKIDFPALKRDLDQLWAEAAEAERTYGPLELPQDVRAELAAAQGARELGDPIDIRLSDAFAGRWGWVPADEVWSVAIPGLRGNPANAEFRRIGAAMRKLGFVGYRRRIDGREGLASTWARWPSEPKFAPRLDRFALDTDAERVEADLLS